jgi:hypothetical protein
MESHVNGPTTLGELRHSILAVVVGNPLFTPEEQLRMNHFAHECEAPVELAQSLRSLRQIDAQRGFQARNQVASTQSQPGVCLDKDAHLREMEALLKCRALDRYQKEPVCWVATPGWGNTDRLKTLGFSYQMLLENLGGYLPPHRGYNALGDN